MNYYPFHVGDYASHTAHLEPMEDLAYRRLLDLYYLREGPLPEDIQATAKLIRMRSCASDVESVLQEFFELTPDGWRHERCEAELQAMREKQKKQRDRANKRWKKPANDSGNAGLHCAGNAVADVARNAAASESDAAASICDAVALPPTPTPTPIEHPSGVGAARTPRPTRKPPATFLVDADLQRWARENVPTVDIRAETEKFRDHTFKTAITDWPGAWRNWMRRTASDPKSARAGRQQLTAEGFI